MQHFGWFSSNVNIWDLFVWFSNTVYYYPLTFEPNVRAVLRSFSEFTVMGKGDFLHINFLEYKRERKETRCWWLFISRFAWTMRWHPLTNWTWKSCQKVRWAKLRHIRWLVHPKKIQNFRHFPYLFHLGEKLKHKKCKK